MMGDQPSSPSSPASPPAPSASDSDSDSNCSSPCSFTYSSTISVTVGRKNSKKPLGSSNCLSRPLSLPASPDPPDPPSRPTSVSRVSMSALRGAAPQPSPHLRPPTEPATGQSPRVFLRGRRTYYIPLVFPLQTPFLPIHPPSIIILYRSAIIIYRSAIIIIIPFSRIL